MTQLPYVPQPQRGVGLRLGLQLGLRLGFAAIWLVGVLVGLRVGFLEIGFLEFGLEADGLDESLFALDATVGLRVVGDFVRLAVGLRKGD